MPAPLEPSTEVLQAELARFPRAKLTVVKGPDKGLSVVLEGQTVVVRSDESCQLKLTDGSVSRRHVELSGGFPSTLRNIANVALLEEYRYYVREEHAVEDDDSSEYTPRLVKARFYPNTEVPHVSDPEFGTEVSDNILDLQLALGIDADGDGTIVEGMEGPSPSPSETPVAVVDKDEDEWLFNASGDVDGEGAVAEATKWNPAAGSPSLAYVRVTTIARTDRRDLGYLAPLLVESEDKDFSESPFDVFNTLGERRFRRRQLQTVVDLRNLS